MIFAQLFSVPHCSLMLPGCNQDVLQHCSCSFDQNSFGFFYASLKTKNPDCSPWSYVSCLKGASVIITQNFHTRIQVFFWYKWRTQSCAVRLLSGTRWACASAGIYIFLNMYFMELLTTTTSATVLNSGFQHVCQGDTELCRLALATCPVHVGSAY